MAVWVVWVDVVVINLQCLPDIPERQALAFKHLYKMGSRLNHNG